MIIVIANSVRSRSNESMHTMTRSQAIEKLRAALLKLADDEHSVCEVAGQKGIFCHGFKQDSDKEFFKKYKWIAKRLGINKREQLEKYANLWQLTQQKTHDNQIACDVQCEEHDTCLGWDMFSNEKLEEFISQICGEEVRIKGDVQPHLMDDQIV